ncbi:hypothetical protein Mapa_005138 [Marchantia paleacea]|nr:hypothetical protein Mapa_005138 [Marchantia paleacea]
MAKLGAVTKLLALVILPLVIQPSKALDYLFWDGPSCTGFVQSLCTAISNGTCCVADSAYQSVQVEEGDQCKSTTTFKDGDCATNVTVTTSTGSMCFNSGGPTYTAASWQGACFNVTPIAVNATANATVNGTTPVARRRALLSKIGPEVAHAEEAGDCTRHVEVNNQVIYYRQGPMKGIWSLRTEGASKSELLEQLLNVPNEDKVFWLFSHGASYDIEGEGRLLDVVEA